MRTGTMPIPCLLLRQDGAGRRGDQEEGLWPAVWRMCQPDGHWPSIRLSTSARGAVRGDFIDSLLAHRLLERRQDDMDPNDPEAMDERQGTNLPPELTR